MMSQRISMPGERILVKGELPNALRDQERPRPRRIDQDIAEDSSSKAPDAFSLVYKRTEAGETIDFYDYDLFGERSPTPCRPVTATVVSVTHSDLLELRRRLLPFTGSSPSCTPSSSRPPASRTRCAARRRTSRPSKHLGAVAAQLEAESLSGHCDSCSTRGRRRCRGRGT